MITVTVKDNIIKSIEINNKEHDYYVEVETYEYRDGDIETYYSINTDCFIKAINHVKLFLRME